MADRHNRRALEHLFGWLVRHFGKRTWIERSGAGLGMTGQFLEMFPNARIIHIVRDGRDAAISMQQHMGFRIFFVMDLLKQSLGVDAVASADRSRGDRVPKELRPFLPEQFEADAVREFKVPLQLCGGFWTQQVEAGLRVLAELPSYHLLTLRYEDFFLDAKKQLDALTAFLGEDFVDDTWSTRCAATVRKPRSTWRDLPPDDVRTLTEACQPGFDLLRGIGVSYDI